MQEFLEPIFYRVQNLFTVLSKELQNINSDDIVNLLINSGVVFLAFYFLSKYFRAYIIRLIFFIFGAWILWQVSGRSHILNTLDFNAGLRNVIAAAWNCRINLPHIKRKNYFYLQSICRVDFTSS